MAGVLRPQRVHRCVKIRDDQIDRRRDVCAVRAEAAEARQLALDLIGQFADADIRLCVGHARAAKICFARLQRQALACHAGIVLQRQNRQIDRTFIVHERTLLRAGEGIARKKAGEPCAADIELPLHVKSVLFDNVLDHAARDGDVCFIHAALVLGKAQFNRKIARIACAQRILLAEIEARRR